MPDLIPIKKSHLTFYNEFNLYHLAKDGKPLLFKKANKQLDKEMLDKNQYPQFFIRKEDEGTVVKKLQAVLNMNLAKTISAKGINSIKQSLCKVLEEALSNPLEGSLSSLPETIEILFFGAKKNSNLLDALVSINSDSPKIIEHTINVLSITMQYCFFKKYPDDEIKKFGLCALLHDIGTSQIDNKILETNEKLTAKEFKSLKTHTIKGYKEIKSHKIFDKSVAMTALEHHELLDGSGYPSEAKQISFEAQVIGLIDSYEPLK